MTGDIKDRTTLQADPPDAMQHPSMVQRWENLSFIHWAFEPDAVRRLVPAELEIDTFGGAAWVGVIPFRLRIRRPGVPYLPWLASFPETNLRTYVLGPDGKPGIWFLSLDAARLGAVAVARMSYRLPYVWARVHMRRDGSTIHYTGVRRWPSRPAAGYDFTLDIGAPMPQPSALDRFLTARWHLFSPGRMRLPAAGVDLERTTVQHEPWPLQAARVVHGEETLLAAAGLPIPFTDPIALFSPGVTTRFDHRQPAEPAFYIGLPRGPI